MGIINLGIPEQTTEFLRKKFDLDVFVEGGTYKGETAKKMSRDFRKVFTIEKSDPMYNFASNELKHIKNVELLKGDTRDHLQNIISKNDNILFWLDAHWSGGKTYGEEDECPLLEELEIIFSNSKNIVILVDDARLFLSPPPQPHKIENWPSLSAIMQIIPTNWELSVLDDVIYIYPKTVDADVKKYMQELNTRKREKYRKENKVSVSNGLRIILKSIVNLGKKVIKKSRTQ